MNFSTALIPLLMGVNTFASHIVSGSNARLPMSLSSVINDLEAEGATKITTVAFLTSRGVTQSTRFNLLKTLFGITADDEEDITDGQTTAFGKKMGDDVEDETDVEDNEDEALGIAVANPLSGASVNEVAATVQACGGNIVYVVSIEDLNRSEGLFDNFAPAMERILNEEIISGEEDEKLQSKNLVVVVAGATTAAELNKAKNTLETAASLTLATIVQPDPKNRKTTLDGIFDSVQYVPSTDSVDEVVSLSCGYSDPSTAASNVAHAVFRGAQTQTTTKGLHNSPLDLAAARKMLPLSRSALNMCLSTVQMNTVGEGGEVGLKADFGPLCDAAVEKTMDSFDKQVGPKLLKSSTVSKRIRQELQEEIYAELEIQYEKQLAFLHVAAFESFKDNLSKLRLSPNLASDMNKVATDAVELFVSTAKTLKAKNGKSWPSASAQTSSLKQELKEYITLRLQKARADGKFRPVPRKGITMGFHWLLPKPFGNDFRMEPWQVHTKDDLIYVPKDRITDVKKEDVVAGDWRDKITPCPTSNELLYMK